MPNFFYKLCSKEFFKKDITLSICIALIFSIILSLIGFDAKCQSVRENVFRLHILANSDSTEDQKIKLEIRDCILAAGNGVFGDAENKDDVILLAKSEVTKFKEIAEKVIKSYGKDYPVTVEIKKTYFDTRVYEDFTLPAGEYDALRLLIGKGEGKNWWCIMFPAMCIPAAKGKKSMAEVAGEGAEQIVKNGQKYKMEFKIVEIFERLKQRKNR